MDDFYRLQRQMQLSGLFALFTMALTFYVDAEYGEPTLLSSEAYQWAYACVEGLHHVAFLWCCWAIWKWYRFHRKKG